VTGIVVNEKVLPPRKLRRRVRAMFHNASKHPEEHAKEINILRGYLSYFSSFPSLKGCQEILNYKKALSKLERYVQQ
jgi:hypothetical protein